MKKDFLCFTPKSLIMLFFLFISTISHATLPFSMNTKAGTTLPTSVSSGSSVNAYYTVTNNTSRERDANFVKWLPPNVEQVTSGGTYDDTCGATFDLAAQGSCTLQLRVFGAVNASDSDPHHHLFVCFPGGTTCAGTPDPLNVVVSSGSSELTSIFIAPSSVAADNPTTDVNVAVGYNATKQLTATGLYADNTTADITSSVNWSSSSTSIATVGSGGNNNGLTTASTLGGETTISASLGSVQGAITLSVNPFAYVVDYNSGSGRTYFCSFSANIIDSCTTTNYGPGKPTGIGSNPTASTIYIADAGTGVVGSETVYVCPVSSSGNITTACTNTNYSSYAPSSFGGQPPAYIAINPLGTIAYLTDANGTGDVAYCKVNTADGTFSACSALCSGSYCGGTGIVISPDNKWAYIGGSQSAGSNTYGVIYACSIVSSGSNAGTFENCSLVYTTTSINGMYGLAINSAGDTLYATQASASGASTITTYTCAISTPGQIASCNGTTQPIATSTPPNVGIALNPAANYAYTVGTANGPSSFCSAPVSALSSCTAPTSPTSFTQLRGIATF